MAQGTAYPFILPIAPMKPRLMDQQSQDCDLRDCRHEQGCQDKDAVFHRQQSLRRPFGLKLLGSWLQAGYHPKGQRHEVQYSQLQIHTHALNKLPLGTCWVTACDPHAGWSNYVQAVSISLFTNDVTCEQKHVTRVDRTCMMWQAVKVCHQCGVVAACFYRQHFS